MNLEQSRKYENAAKIFEHYVPGCLTKRTVKSPLSSDKRPSFSVFYSRNKGTLIFKDHRGIVGDAIGLICRIENISVSDALKKAEDIVGKINTIFIPTETEFKTTMHLDIVTDIEFCDFFPNDISWFKSHMIDIDIAKQEIKNIKKYSTIYVNKISMPGRRMFYYDYSHYEKDAYKIYETNPKMFLAYYNDGNKIIDGLIEIRQKYKNENKLNHIILIHGKKNYLVLKSLGYNVVARQSETPLSIDMDIINELKTYTNNLVLFGDNDYDKIENWGFKMGMEVANEAKIKFATYETEICKLAKDSDIAGIAKYLLKEKRKNEIYDIINNLIGI